jgi:uncharacterized protein (DUF1501 family)
MADMRRRDLLRAAAGLAPLTVAGRLTAAPQTSTRLLLVFLRGAYDATNVIVPVASDFYYAARPTIAIVRPDPANPNAAIPLAAGWGLHPALADTLLPLWSKGEIAFVPFAGTDDLSRSHFETQDVIELGQPLSGTRNYGSGFMSRLAGQLTGTAASAFTDQLPLIFRGGAPIPNIAINQVGKPTVDAREAGLIEGMYQGETLAPAVREGFAVRDEVYQSVAAEMVAASRGAVSPKGFELSARRIARLMQSQFNLGFVDIGGWDTHVNQVAAQPTAGQLANNLADFGQSLAAFYQDLGDRMADVVVVTMSEFGRTARENGNRGTDHGHANAMFIMGGDVRGGKVYGDWPGLADEQLYEGRDLNLTTDFRDVLGELVGKHLGNNNLKSVFPGYGDPKFRGILA